MNAAADIAQWVAVALIVTIAVVWAIRRAARKTKGGGACDDACGGCPIADNCGRQKKKR